MTPRIIPFSERIKSRYQRWWIEKQSHPYKQLGGKLVGREFALELGVSVPELYRVTDRIDDIPEFDALPDRFVVKPTRGWSAKNVYLMDGGINALDGLPWTRERIVDQIHTDIGDHARGVRYIVEEYLTNWDGKPGIPYDYKFFMFGDRIALIHVIERNSASETNRNRHWYMTESWETITRKIVITQKPEVVSLPAPDCIESLIDTTKKIGKRLNMFMRIDMYATTRGPVFGEFTPQPHGGNGFTPWADDWLGGLWRGDEGVA